MFTGLVETIGNVRSIETRGGEASLWIDASWPQANEYELGESIAVDGACLTVSAFDEKGFAAQASSETLAKTTLGQRKAGDGVHLEHALAAGDRIGGHFVSGHVDAVGDVALHEKNGDSLLFGVRVQKELLPMIAKKGSITVNGVSLTVNAVQDDIVRIMLVPFTLEKTTLGRLRPEARVNLEVDILARYVVRALQSGATFAANAAEGLENALREHGYVGR